MRQLNVKIAVTLFIITAILLVGWYLNQYTERTYPNRQIYFQQLDVDQQNFDQDARNINDAYRKPFGPREYIRIYPKNTGD